MLNSSTIFSALQTNSCMVYNIYMVHDFVLMLTIATVAIGRQSISRATCTIVAASCVVANLSTTAISVTTFVGICMRITIGMHVVLTTNIHTVMYTHIQTNTNTHTYTHIHTYMYVQAHCIHTDTSSLIRVQLISSIT